MSNALTMPEIKTMEEALGLIAAMSKQIEELLAQNGLLRGKVDALIRRYFGKKSEQIDVRQLELLLAGLTQKREEPVQNQAASVSAPAKNASKPLPTRRRRELPENLPVERIEVEPAEVTSAPDLWKRIGEEVTEELDYTPGQFSRRLYVRAKYVRRQEVDMEEQSGSPEVLIAPLPPRLVERGMVGPGLMAHVLVSKYEDHLPLYRQAKIFRERHGVRLAVQTLSEWVERGAEWLRPIYDLIREELLAGDYLQVDETPIRYLDPDVPGKARQGYLWTYSRPGADVLFDWQTSRGKEAARWLKQFRGYLQVDGYGVYESVASEQEGIVLVGCWAHARRKFVDALGENRRAAWVVHQIGLLYEVEKRLRQARAGPRLREAVRRSESVPLLRRIEKALRRWRERLLPKSLFGEAMNYALVRWESLCVYVRDGRLAIDNNLVENAIRPTAVGKKNWLFIGHPEAGWRSAVLYTILGSCRRAGIDPWEYLQDVLKRLPSMKMSEVKSIVPTAWAKAKKAAKK